MEFPHIISDPDILGGKPIIKGSRISVQLILEWIAGGATVQDILRKYPHLTEAGIQEALLYASRFASNDILIEVKTEAA